MKQGAYDYLAKPFDIDEVAVVIERALEARRLRVDNRRLAAEQTLGRRIIGDSRPMRRLLEATVARRVARRHRARARRDRHRQGVRRRAAPRAVGARRASRWSASTAPPSPPSSPTPSCSATCRARSPARPRARPGFFAQADGGTLILDEVGELPLAIQAKLLRALQEGEIQPVGSGRIDKVNVRVVASTNRDLAADVKAGTFREDLYYRLAVVELVVPPLRDRKDDIPALADGVRAPLRRAVRPRHGRARARARSTRSPAPSWPGNVRQLENTIARLAALSTGGAIGARRPRAGDRPATEQQLVVDAAARRRRATTRAPDARNGPSLKEQVEAFERGLVARALDATGGNQSEAARRLGVSPRHADRQDEEVQLEPEALTPRWRRVRRLYPVCLLRSPRDTLHAMQEDVGRRVLR